MGNGFTFGKNRFSEEIHLAAMKVCPPKTSPKNRIVAAAAIFASLFFVPCSAMAQTDAGLLKQINCVLDCEPLDGEIDQSGTIIRSILIVPLRMVGDGPEKSIAEARVLLRANSPNMVCLRARTAGGGYTPVWRYSRPTGVGEGYGRFEFDDTQIERLTSGRASFIAYSLSEAKPGEDGASEETCNNASLGLAKNKLKQAHPIIFSAKPLDETMQLLIRANGGGPHPVSLRVEPIDGDGSETNAGLCSRDHDGNRPEDFLCMLPLKLASGRPVTVIVSRWIRGLESKEMFRLNLPSVTP